MADFERSNARTNDTLPQMSVVNGELWDAEATTEVHGSVASLEQKDGQCVIDPDSAGSRLRVAINHYLANTAGEDGIDAIAVESPSQHKRLRPGGNQGSRTASFSDGVSKRVFLRSHS